MQIGTIADELGLPASTIRYYEKVGLIERQRRVSGRRQFDERAVLNLKFVQLAQAAGFSIAETKQLLRHHREDPSPLGLWKPVAEEKRKAIRGQIGALRQMDGILTELMKCECETLDQCVRAADSKSQKSERKKRA
jgi:DNA-binding transcriptional MerR regulator